MSRSQKWTTWTFVHIVNVKLFHFVVPSYMDTTHIFLVLVFFITKTLRNEEKLISTCRILIMPLRCVPLINWWHFLCFKWIPQNVSMTPSIWNLDQAKLIYGDRGQNSDYLWAGGCCSNWRKGTQETSVMETFYLLIQVVITWVKVFEICELCAWVYV